MHSIFIVHTTDGGATWGDQVSIAQSDEAWSSGERIMFVDRQRGWVEAGGSLWRTTNGGGAWARIEPSDMPDRLLRFINATTGFGVTTPWQSSPILLRTTDAGASWAGVGQVPDWADALWVASNGATVWAVGQGGQIAHSANLGVSWTPIASPTTNRLSHLVFTGDLIGWAAGDGGAVLKTTDGGWHWEMQPAGTTQSIASLAAAGSANAWISADVLRRTRDAGAHWSPLRTTNAAPLYAVRMASASVGWAGGANPTLLKTANGGRIWADVVPAASRDPGHRRDG